MTLPRRIGLGISLGVIVLFRIYQVVSHHPGPGLILGVALSSAMFGYGHLYQGVATALGTMLSGIVFSLVYLRRRSALEPVTAHAFSDVLAMLGATMLAK